MAEVLIPEKRGGLAGLMNMFSQGAGMLKMGGEGKEGFAKLMGSGGGGGDVSGLGSGAGAYKLGVKAFTPASEGMAPTLGGETAAAGETATGAGFGETAAAYAPYAAPVVAGYAEYKALEDKKKTGDAGKYNERTGHRAQGGVTHIGRRLGEKAKLPKMPTISSGLSLTSPDKMSSIERRYTNTKDAMSSIDAAQKALSEAQLPDAERRSINQKLELAKRSGRK